MHFSGRCRFAPSLSAPSAITRPLRRRNLLRAMARDGCWRGPACGRERAEVSGRLFHDLHVHHAHGLPVQFRGRHPLPDLSSLCTCCRPLSAPAPNVATATSAVAACSPRRCRRTCAGVALPLAFQRKFGHRFTRARRGCHGRSRRGWLACGKGGRRLHFAVSFELQKLRLLLEQLLLRPRALGQHLSHRLLHLRPRTHRAQQCTSAERTAQGNSDAGGASAADGSVLKRGGTRRAHSDCTRDTGGGQNLQNLLGRHFHVERLPGIVARMGVGRSQPRDHPLGSPRAAQRRNRKAERAR